MPIVPPLSPLSQQGGPMLRAAGPPCSMAGLGAIDNQGKLQNRAL